MKKHIPFYCVLLLFMMQAHLSGQTQKEGGQLLSDNHKVMIIPFNINNYFSDADMELAKANKKEQQEISTMFRYGLNYNVNARVITEYDTYSILIDSTVQSEKDLKMIYDAVSYRYETPMDIITPDTMKRKKLIGLDQLIKNGQDDKNMQETKSPVQELKADKYLNAVVNHKEIFPILESRYGADLFLFINQFELKTNYEHCLDRASNNFEREVIVHFSLYDANGKQLKGGVLSVTFPSNSNNIDEIIGKNFPGIGDYLKGSVGNVYHPVMTQKGE